MNPIHARTLRDLFAHQQVAALGTLHEGQPLVSMVPFAVLPERSDLVIHVSQLAAHTRDMLANPAVSVMVMASPSAETPPQALARASIQGRATRYDESDPGYPAAKAAYLRRFPTSLEMFGFSDFSLVRIEAVSVRFVGGFAQATTLTAEAFSDVLRG